MHETKGFGAEAENRWLLFEKGRRGSNSLWINPKNGVVEAVPRHKEIKEPLARKILKKLNAE